MTLPNINDFDDLIFGKGDVITGDTVQYSASGASGYLPVPAIVKYGEAIRNVVTGDLVDQDIEVKVAVYFIPTKPTKAARLILPRYPAKTFKPANVTEDGDDWLISVQSA